MEQQDCNLRNKYLFYTEYKTTRSGESQDRFAGNRLL